MATATAFSPKKQQLSFPPLVSKFHPSGQYASWPGAEYTRRTKMKARCVEEYSAAFLDEMRAILGERGFEAYEAALQPSISRRLSRGKPPEEGGASAIQPRARLERDGGELSQTLGSSTATLSGHTSRARVLELTHTRWGDVPSHMFDNKPAEPVASLDEWFLTYGRPTPSSLNLGPKNVYTVSQTHPMPGCPKILPPPSLIVSAFPCPSSCPFARPGVPALKQASMRRPLTSATDEEGVRNRVRFAPERTPPNLIEEKLLLWDESS